MLPYLPESTSELLRARQITVVILESATLGEWDTEDPSLAARDVRAMVRIERVLKGELMAPPDGRVEITFRIFEVRGPRYAALPGIWSRHLLVPGGRYIVFSGGASDRADLALSEPPAFRVETESALAEIGAVMDAATPDRDLPAFLAAIAAAAPLFTYLTARYVAARLREVLFQDIRGFNAVLRVAEQLETSRIFRRIVMVEAYDDLIMLAPAPPVFVARLIWGSVQAIVSGAAADLASLLLETYIPALVGIEGGLPRRTAEEVFTAAPQPRLLVADQLRGHPDLPGRDKVLQWVES